MYKRQGVYHVGPRQLSSAMFLLVVFELLFSFLREGDRSGGSDMMYIWNVMLVPVSYTHLDVYKRQGLCGDVLQRQHY